MKALLAGAGLALAALPAAGQDTTVYRVLQVRAAPGALEHVLEQWKARRRALAADGHVAVLMRHSQGDQWDLMVLQPVGSMAAWYARDNAVRAAQERFERGLRDQLAWRQEMFATGPIADTLRARVAGTGLFHIEMFHAAPGRYDSLLAERRMEDDYLERTGRAANLIFERVAGASWDLFTIGFYRDLQHFAADPALPAETIEAAARAAGFPARSAIGFVLRRYLADHRDTLASAVP